MKLYPRDFSADGWPGFLGTGASNAAIVGMVPASKVSRVAHLDWYVWKAASKDLAPDAERPADVRKATTRAYYRPQRVVAFLVERGLTSSSEAPRVLAQLEAMATPPLKRQA